MGDAGERDDFGDVPPATRARYRRLGELIGALADQPHRLTSDGAWKQRVLAEMDRPARAARAALPRRRWVTAAMALAAAALIVLALVKLLADDPDRRPADAGPALRVAVRSSGGVVRSSQDTVRAGDAVIGDTVVAHGVADGPSELRIYGDGGLLARCGEHGVGGCTVRRRGSMEERVLELPIASRGRFRPLLLIGPAIPPPQGSLDRDLAAAGSAVRVIHVTPIEAR